MLITRLGKTAMVAAIAFYASLVAFGNITDYGTNYAFVEHVLKMDTIFPGSTIAYRAIDTTWMWQAFYLLIIAAETGTAIVCWIGAVAMLRRLRDDARLFNRAKAWGIGGLSFGFLLWQVAFMSVGGMVRHVAIPDLERRGHGIPDLHDRPFGADLRRPQGRRAPRLIATVSSTCSRP